MKAAVIDPGGSVDAVMGEVKRRGLALDQIWITHGHLDHAGGAPIRYAGFQVRPKHRRPR